MLISFVVLTLLAVSTEPPKAESKKDDKKTALSDAAKKELKKLEGKWQVVKGATTKGEGEVAAGEFFITFKDAKMTVSAKSKDKTETVEITGLDPSTDPKCIDLLENVGSESTPERTLEGVYKIDGDTLVLAFAVPKGGKIRPTSFDKPTDDRVLVWTLKRVKE